MNNEVWYRWSGAGVGVGMLRVIPRYWFSKMCNNVQDFEDSKNWFSKMHQNRFQRFQNMTFQDVLRLLRPQDSAKSNHEYLKNINDFQNYVRFTGFTKIVRESNMLQDSIISWYSKVLILFKYLNTIFWLPSVFTI